MSLVPVPRRADWIRWFVPEPPGADAMAAHMTRTGRGEVFADRWPEPRLLLLSADGDVLLRGDPAAVPASALAGRVRGFVDAPADFEPVLREVAGSVIVWQRVVQVLDGVAPPPGPAARRLRPADADALAALPVELRWIWKTWGGPAQLWVRASPGARSTARRWRRWRARSTSGPGMRRWAW